MRREPMVLLIFLCAISSARAQAPSDTSDPLALEVHGFVSQGFLLGTGNNFLARTKRGSFEFTEVGINFTKQLTNELRAGLQIFARDLGPVGNYDAKLDWFYLDYRFTDWFGIRAGRTKLPFGLYNEVSDVDAAHGVVLLPQSVYPTQNRDFLLAQTGVELYGYVRLGGAGALDYRLYGGTVFLEVEDAPGSPYAVTNLNIPYVAGGRVLWELPLDGLRVGGSVQVLQLDTELLVDPMLWQPIQMMGDLPDDFMGEVQVDIPALLWIGSIEYWADELRLAVEYSRWRVETEISHPALFPASPDTTSERAHAMLSYRVAPWLLPGIYYALIYPDVGERKGRAAQRHDVAGTLRFDLDSHLIIKVEGHLLHGTAELRPALNDGVPLEELERTWTLFAVKATAYF
jgi:hypothetical protein